MNEAPRQPAVVPAALGGFGEFALERFPFAAAAAIAALESVIPSGGQPLDARALDDLRVPFSAALEQRLSHLLPPGLGETTPRVVAGRRFAQAVEEIRDACDGFLRRAAIRASLDAGERREILRGMLLTRATDNRLKTFFTSGEVRFRDSPFQGKGFRSLGQEAIYAAGIRLRRGEQYRTAGGWTGDVIAPIIRDLGAALAMRPSPETVRMVLSAQMAKAGPPMDGKDLHVGDLAWGILPASAPLAIGSLTLAGMALAFQREASGRVAVSFIGEGGSSLGEWHEAINLCAARRLPAVFILENNQTALSTPVREQAAVRVFADKAAGYGIPGVTIDGTDADEIASAVTWAVERARAGLGPALIELVAMRMCGHAHHDDMLYLGRDTPPSWEYPRPTDSGYADREAYAYWSGCDPIDRYAGRLLADGVIRDGELEQWKTEIAALVEREASAVIAAEWPDPSLAGAGVVAGEPPRVRVEMLDPAWRQSIDRDPALPDVDPGPAFDRNGATFLEGIAAGVRDALAADPRVFVFGEDVGGAYGNAFLLLRPLL